MFDTMTFTKVAGGFLGAFLIYLLGGWVGETLYATSGHGHHEQAYVIDTGGDEAPAEEVEEVDFATLYAAADAGSGERVFRQCRACHMLNGEDGTGPHLNGVVGREIGQIAGFGYSGALSETGAEVWSPENLNAFLVNPREWAPGTSMGYAGLRSPEDRANLIAYLDSTE